MFQFNPFIPSIFCAFFILLSGSFVLFKNPKSKVTQSFFFSTVATFIWLSTYSLANNLNLNTDQQTLLLRIGYCGVSFISIFYFSLSASFINIQNLKLFTYFNFCYGIVIALIILKTNYIVNDIYYYPWGIYPKAGNFHPLFLIYFMFLIVAGLIIGAIELSNKQDNKKFTHLKYIVFSSSIYSFACVDFMPNYGINIYPIGFIFATLFSLTIFYGIIKYQLMEVHVIIKRGLIYSIILTLISIIFLTSTIIFEKIFQGFLGYKTLTASLITTILILILTNPLRTKLQFTIEKSLFKSSSFEAIEENELLRKEVANTERLRAIATLASGLIHEIRNPLTSLTVFAEQLQSRKNDPEFLDKCQKIFLKETGRVNELLTQLLTFAKPTPPSLQRIDPEQLINDTLLLLSPQVESQGIKIERTFPKNQLITADPNQLKQAFLNIILNALDAMPNGGIMSIDTNIQNNYYVISIKDTGLGIAEKDLNHIFDPFFSLKEKGTGLGLAITHGIIEQHKGKITVKSQITKGAEFNVFLPLA